MSKTTLFPCLLIAAVAAGSGCSKPPAPAPPAPKVTVSRPQTATVTNWDEYPGHIEAVEMVEVRPRVSGYLESIHFTDGAEVKAGELLFVIDPKPYQADLDHAAAQRRQAETHLELARNDLKRAEDLRGTKAISEEEYRQPQQRRAGRGGGAGGGAARRRPPQAQRGIHAHYCARQRQNRAAAGDRRQPGATASQRWSDGVGDDCLAGPDLLLL